MICLVAFPVAVAATFPTLMRFPSWLAFPNPSCRKAREIWSQGRWLLSHHIICSIPIHFGWSDCSPYYVLSPRLFRLWARQTEMQNLQRVLFDESCFKDLNVACDLWKESLEFACSNLDCYKTRLHLQVIPRGGMWQPHILSLFCCYVFCLEAPKLGYHQILPRFRNKGRHILKSPSLPSLIHHNMPWNKVFPSKQKISFTDCFITFGGSPKHTPTSD